jgi:hypothetical protein
MSFGIQTRGLLTPGQRVFRHKSRITGRTVEFYSERGMVSIHGELPNVPGQNQPDNGEDFKRCTLREFLQRADALNQEVRRLLRIAHDDGTHARRYRQEAGDLQALVECMIAAARHARDQGDPIATLTRGLAAHREPGRRLLVTPGLDFTPGPIPPLRAPVGAPVMDLGGTQKVRPDQLIITPGRPKR